MSGHHRQCKTVNDSAEIANSQVNVRVDNIKKNIPEEWKVLNCVYEWLQSGSVIPTTQNAQDKVVEFLQPKELMQKLDLRIDSDNEELNIQEIEKLCREVIKYSVKTGNPGFHNQLFGQVDPYGLIGAWITEALNTSSYTFEVAPVFSLIETEIIRKVCELIGFHHGDGIFSPGGSISNMYGIVLARYKRFPNIKNEGLFGQAPMVIFSSQDGHYSIIKAANWLGFGDQNCVIVKTNEHGQMLTADLEKQIERVLSEGRIPLFVNATAGTTVFGAFDDIQSLAQVCAKYSIWLHIDGCLGGSAMLSQKHLRLLSGMELSDSFSWNPHKTLGAPLQCSLFLTKYPELLSQCNSLEVNYLFQQDKYYDVSFDTGNKSIQCGRKVDAFKLWLMLKARGTASYGSLVNNAIEMAQLLTNKLRERGEKQGYRLVLNEFQYSNVCFWYIPKVMRGQPETEEWWERLNDVAPKIKELMAHEGKLLIGYSPLKHHGLKNFLRMVITCFPIMDGTQLDALLDEIAHLGENIDI